MAWTVYWHPEAEPERAELPANERVALDNCVAKLAQFGPQLPYPHSSAVKNADRLRELRPRAGRSAWRAFYRQFRQEFVIGSVGPEANVKPRLFTRAIQAAEQRLEKVEEG